MFLSSVATALEAVIFLSPAFVLLVALVACVRVWRGRSWRRAVVNSVLDVLTLGALFPIITLALLSSGTNGGVSLVPFADMADSGFFGGMTGIYQNGGNIAMFMPLGALLPLAWGGRSAGFARVLAAAAAVSLGVEVLQYALGTGHVSSVDDVILNSAGALCGAALTWPWWRVRERAAMEPEPATATRAKGVSTSSSRVM